jgi:poly-gamma-glutamate synthesis protein (capsule biosynthesis protein)
MSKKILSIFAFALVLLAGGYGFYYVNLSAGTLSDNLISPPKTYFSSDRSIHAVILSQKDTKIPELNRRNLNHAAITLFNNLKKDQAIDRIVLVFDPAFPANEVDPFQAQVKSSFPQAKYSTLHPRPEQSENDLYSELSYSHTAGTLIILHSYLNYTDFDPDLLELQKAHYKDAFDNLSKASLETIAFTNSTALKAVYQLAKEAGARKALPTLEDNIQGYQIKFLAEGTSTSTQNINLTFFGDMMLGRHVRQLMDKNSLDYPFQKMDNSYLQINDLLIANLEGPVAEKAVPTSKAIAFRFLPDIIPLLKKYHFDALSLANNHALDMGAGGLADSYRLLANAALTPFGHPNQITPHSAALFDLHGQKIAILGLNHTDFKLDKKATLAHIQKLTAEGYRVIPFIHWGTEYVHKPGNTEVELAHSFVDAGAIAVIGMHPHVVQSIEIYNDTPIFYSLGNAIFDQYFSPDTQEGLSLSMRLTETEMQLYLVPIKIEQGQFRLMLPEEKTKFLAKLVDWWRYDEQTKEQILKGKIIIRYSKD